VSADHATNRYPFVNDHGTLFEPGTATVDLRQNADEETLDAWGVGHVDLGNGARVDVVANGITREQGVASLALLPTRRARERTDRALGGVDLRVPIPCAAHAVVESQTSVLAGSSTYDDPLRELALYTTHLQEGGWRVGESLGMRLEPTDRWRIRPVVDLAHEQIVRDPDDIPAGRARREFARAAVSTEYAIAEDIAVHALASGECHHTGARGSAACDVLEPTGRVGVELGHDRIQGYANAGRYVRIPTLGEVYGIASTVHGNPDLRPEDGLTVDAGVRLRSRRGGAFDGAFLDAFGFARWARGLIAYERGGQGFVVPYNVGAARVVGAEILGGAGFFRLLRAEVAATVLDPRDTSPDRTTVNDVLPYRSRLVVAPQLRADWKRRGSQGVTGAGGSAGLVYQSSRYADPAGLGVIDPQTTVDVDAYVAFFGGVLTIRGRVADLFDAPRTDIVGYPLPGRSAYFGMEATW
jgi:iron complex outermembrane receptor protein